ncbi:MULTISPECIES: TonB-dependent receptor [unclassified Duganella]|uniref:TonB-dependent receptor n=1 Tax=unclassified Duganella TaxID=2636909 RepID=UPI0011C106C1|nr:MULTISPECIES: TonB-dependent receptor [unclassified Duganella]
MNNPKKTAIAMGVAQLVLMASGAVMAQTAPAVDATPTVIVSGQRAALQSAQKLKQNADEIIDSVVADDIGKLPDKSVTEVLQRMPGVTINRTLSRSDPLQGVGEDGRFAAEGTGVSIRGLNYVRSELNGRDSFSANGGRALSFEDVPPELLAGVDIYKNPSAEQIEGGIGGLVNLRTAMPFDFKGLKAAVSAEASRASLRGNTKPSLSGMVSNRWETPLGQFGALLDLSHSEISTRSNGMGVGHYYSRTDAVIGDTSGQERWITPGVNWNTSDFDRTRDGLYGALQWKKGDILSGLTYFKSKYKLVTAENALYTSSNPRNVTLDPGATFDASGALLTGTLRNTKDNGIGFGSNARSVGRESETTDIAWNTKWRVSPQLQVQADLQHTRSTTDGSDNLVALAGQMPKQTVNLSGSIPVLTFDDADRAFLAKPSSYNWDSTQQHRDHAVATQSALRLDGTYSFDHPVLNDLRFGVRATDRSSLTQANTPNSQWTALGATWATGDAGWQPLSSFINLADPRFAGNTTTQAFSGFFNGKTPLPAPLIVPDASLTTGGSPPPGFTTLHNFVQAVCKPDHKSDGICNWTPAPFGDPIARNQQSERTTSAFGQLRFGFENLPYPVDGTVGLRVVRTEETAVGRTLFTPPTVAAGLVGVPVIAAINDEQTLHHNYTNTLPSLNLRMKAGSELQFRFAVSQGISRPDFYRMQAYTTLGVNPKTHNDAAGNPVLDSIEYTGTANGNTMLKPTRSNNFDLTAEYYFGASSSATLSLFHKKLKDIVVDKTTYYPLTDSAGQAHNFLLNSPVNGADGRVTGFEAAYQQYFDKLPGLLSGIGVSLNYTYIDSRLDMGLPKDRQWCTPSSAANDLIASLGGCDTNGRFLGDLPVSGLSKNAFNVALLYDKGPWSARLAYSWRSQALGSVHTWGTYGTDGIDRNPASPNAGNGYSVNYVVPSWSGGYGQADLGVQYKPTENTTLAFDVSNLTDALYKSYNQQGIGLKLTGVNYTGRRFTLQARYSF